ncbi:MAG: alanine dehydrogenase [Nitrococcus mobilis]|nr:alanine dehydrogenase [Nitrococcus mobilis]
MLVAVPKEIKNHEYRVGLTPDSVREFVAHRHEVLVETGAGEGIGCSDDAYETCGARIVANAEELYRAADLIIKVKEPQSEERRRLQEGQILFAYLHLAPDAIQTRELLRSKAVCIAYETVTGPNNQLPLLTPMSQVAGRMSIQAGAYCLERVHGGSGMLLGGVPGVPPARVVVIGGGVVGQNAIAMALGMGAEVVVLDRDLEVLRRLAYHFGPALTTVYSTRTALEQYVLQAELIIGAVLVAGAETPKLVTAETVRRLKPGTVLVDVAIDQGGCFETSRPTTHADPTYIVDGVVHYCVTNMPGAVPKTSTFALNNAILPYALAIADKGYRQAMLDDPHLRQGLNIHQGQVTHRAVAEEHGYPFVEPLAALQSTH